MHSWEGNLKACVFRARTSKYNLLAAFQICVEETVDKLSPNQQNLFFLICFESLTLTFSEIIKFRRMRWSRHVVRVHSIYLTCSTSALDLFERLVQNILKKQTGRINFQDPGCARIIILKQSLNKVSYIVVCIYSADCFDHSSNRSGTERLLHFTERNFFTR